jgi:two-component system NtrC family response regulator/two-component system response regulator HydG
VDDDAEARASVTRLLRAEGFTPSLRSRAGDIPLLAVHFLRGCARESNKEIQGFTDEALHQLVHYTWPGNVRQLENAVERAVVICRGANITAAELSPTLGVPVAAAVALDGMPPIPGATVAELERSAIVATYDAQPHG